MINNAISSILLYSHEVRCGVAILFSRDTEESGSCSLATVNV
uniref:Uncharacterized protein n=1 Tax=Anguilla anguilla TaxID=7936 RepID=A0A0E9WP16_ANGAN